MWLIGALISQFHGFATSTLPHRTSSCAMEEDNPSLDDWEQIPRLFPEDIAKPIQRAEIRQTPEHRGGDAARAAGRPPRGDMKSCEAENEPQDFLSVGESPARGIQAPDVASIAKELVAVAVEQFLAWRQGQLNRSFASGPREYGEPPDLTTPAEQLPAVTASPAGGALVPVGTARFLACPLYIRNDKYSECVTRHYLPTIEDVREHVICVHRRRMFCPVCKEEFSSARDRDAHIRLRTCHLNTSASPEGITDSQEEMLECEGESPLCEEQQWFRIWDIIFPHVDRPSSAFYTAEREVSVCAFRQFWTQAGEELVTSFLEENHYEDCNIKTEERTFEAIYDLVEETVADRIFGGADAMAVEQ